MTQSLPPVAPLMGARFRPPAKIVLQYLPAGTPLTIEPEPENPYDPNAQRVVLAREHFPSCDDDPQLEEHLAASGISRADFEALPSLHLGYIAREFAPIWAQWHTAKLTFDAAGRPQVTPVEEPT